MTPPMANAAEIAADLAELRAARLALAKGERVKEVMRDGRRLTYGEVTLDGLSKLIKVYESDLEAATAAESGKPRRRPVGLVYGN